LGSFHADLELFQVVDIEDEHAITVLK